MNTLEEPGNGIATQELHSQKLETVDKPYKRDLKWKNIILLAGFHAGALWTLIMFPYIKYWKLAIYGYILAYANGVAITAGVHRLWSHRTYKATLPLRIFIMILYTSSGENSIYDWVRDHRVHHKFSDTDADPHNASRGFFFSHIGWLMQKKHPEVTRKGKDVDMSDVWDDPVVRFNHKYFGRLKLLLCFTIPTIIPPLCWGEDWFWSIMLICFLRYVIVINSSWTINSAAHLWGTRPYNKTLMPKENKYVAAFTAGEGWHNYHHTFPWDYKASELGNYSSNFTTLVIDVFAKLGLAYDLKSPSKELVRRVITKKGDGTHPVWGHTEVPESAEEEIPKEE